MTRSEKREIENTRACMALQFQHFRLTDHDESYLVLGAVLTLSVSINRDDTGSIPTEALAAEIVNLQEKEARLYQVPPETPLSEDQIWHELRELAARNVLAFEIPAPGCIIATPLIRGWKDLPSVRLDHKGNILRRDW